MRSKKFMMRKTIVALCLLIISWFCFATTQPYGDCFCIENHLNYSISVQYRESKILVPNPYGFSLDIGEGYKINLKRSWFYDEGGQDLIKSNDFSLFNQYSYSNKKYYRMGWFARFLLISGELTVKDEDGNILMTLDTITPEDFEVTEVAGITTATLVIRDK